MGTALSDVIGFTRVALQDYDPNCYVYSDPALTQQLNFTAMTASLNPENLAGSINLYPQTVPGTYDNALTIQQIVILTCTTAIRIISGRPDKFSYKSPAMSVSREGGNIPLIDRLQDLLDLAMGGKFAMEIDTDFNVIIQSFDRYINDYDRASSAFPGAPGITVLSNNNP